MYTERELLLFAGKLAITAHRVINSNTMSLSQYIEEMNLALENYNTAIITNLNEGGETHE